MEIKYAVIGLTGRAGAGKDTVADIVMEHVPCAAVRIAFAQELRKEVTKAFNVSASFLLDRQWKEVPTGALAFAQSQDTAFVERMRELGLNVYAARSPREVMQLWGTEYRRYQNVNYWLDKAHDKVDQYHRLGYKTFIFTDVRFPQEAGFVKSLGGQVWRIRRELAELTPNAHDSEDPNNIQADLELMNNGTITELSTKVLELLARARGAV